MLRVIKERFLLIFFFFTALLSAQETFTIRVVVNDAPPYRIISGDYFSGIYIDIIKAISEKNKISLKFIEAPFKRELYMMKYGSADMMLGPNRNDEREKYMEYLLDVPLPRANKVFYTRFDSGSITRYESLRGKTIAVLRGGVYFDRFDKDDTLAKFEVSDYESGLKMVEVKRLDAIIIPEYIGSYLLKEMHLELKKSPYIIEGNLSYITISRKSPIYGKMDIIEEALKAAWQNGTVDSIIRSYAGNGP